MDITLNSSILNINTSEVFQCNTNTYCICDFDVNKFDVFLYVTNLKAALLVVLSEIEIVKNERLIK